ncbi:ATP-dependent Clp protease adapter ClpS, partial [bacterium]|nr:ATP-dependent Clp protease adapter ClpS [bacterium]
MEQIGKEIDVKMIIWCNANHEDVDDQEIGDVDTIVRKEVKRPSRYKVILHNDDYTTMEFVIHVLTRFFNKDQDQAEDIMWKIHQEGYGVCGIYSYEIAETKKQKVLQCAKEQAHPLRCTME